MTPRVAGVIRRSTSAGSTVGSSGPMESAKTGRPPLSATALALATNVRVGTITSVPGPTPSARQERCSAAVQLATATAESTPQNAANSSSRAPTSRPSVSQPLSTTRSTAARSSSPRHSSESGIFHAIASDDEALVHVLELLVGAREVVVATEVEPVLGMHMRAHRPVRVQQREHEIREVHPGVGGDQLDRGAAERVDAHADEVLVLRLLAVRDEGVAFDLEDAQLVADLASKRRDGERRVAARVLFEEVAEREIAEHVAVHDDERVPRHVDLCQRSDRAERRGLTVVVDLHLPPVTRPAVDLDQVSEVPNGERGPGAAGAAELREHQIQDRPLADRQEGLGEDVRERRQPRPLATGKDDRFEAHADPTARTRISPESRTRPGRGRTPVRFM